MKKFYLLLLFVSSLLLSCSSSDDNPNIPVKAIEISKGSSFKLLKGNTEALVIKFTPKDASNKEISWTTSDENIATVDYGVVTGVNLGKVTITATVGDKKSECEVEVYDIFSIKSGSDLEIGVGDTEELLIVQAVSGYMVNEITWESKDADVVTAVKKEVEQGATDSEKEIAEYTGVVTGVGAGKTEIKVTVKGIEYITSAFMPTPFERTIDINVDCK